MRAGTGRGNIPAVKVLNGVVTGTRIAMKIDGDVFEWKSCIMRYDFPGKINLAFRSIGSYAKRTLPWCTNLYLFPLHECRSRNNALMFTLFLSGGWHYSDEYENLYLKSKHDWDARTNNRYDLKCYSNSPHLHELTHGKSLHLCWMRMEKSTRKSSFLLKSWWNKSAGNIRWNWIPMWNLVARSSSRLHRWNFICSFKRRKMIWSDWLYGFIMMARCSIISRKQEFLGLDIVRESSTNFEMNLCFEKSSDKFFSFVQPIWKNLFII